MQTQYAMPPAEFAERTRRFLGELFEAIRRAPSRLQRVYGQPPSGPMKGADFMGSISNTAATGARGLGQLKQKFREMQK